MQVRWPLGLHSQLSESSQGEKERKGRPPPATWACLSSTCLAHLSEPASPSLPWGPVVGLGVAAGFHGFPSESDPTSFHVVELGAFLFFCELFISLAVFL